MKTILLTGGGTAGHCIPHLALIDELKKHFDKIYYIGSYNGMEKSIMKNANIEYFAVSCAKLNRKFDINNFTIPFKLLKGIHQANKIIEKIKPNIIFSKGGYVAIPTIIAGKKHNIPVITHESDFTIGLANKLSSKYCKKVLTSFPETAKTVKNGEFVGSPLRQELLKTKKSESLKNLGLSGKKPVLLITGGSLGSVALNNCVRRSLPTLLEKFDVLHLCGKNNKSKINKQGYIQKEFINNMYDAYSACDLCVSRAGSNTVFELIALKKPCILIPLPKGVSRGDQVDNAEYFQKQGLVYVLPQNVLTDKSLVYAVNSVYSNRNKIFNKNKIDDYIANDKIVNILINYSLKD